ncbi:MAG: hypothetical protein ABII09_08885 [Planctomycetota bacterium]
MVRASLLTVDDEGYMLELMRSNLRKDDFKTAGWLFVEARE